MVVRVGVHVQVLAVLSTVARPSGVAPLKIKTYSPTASAEVIVPVIVGVRSSVLPAAGTVPWIKPMLSLTAVMAAVVSGAVVSSEKARAVEATPRFPAASATRAVIE